ncbi:MAG: glycosyltransferase family 2 protein [Lachnospiraceae bacterium]|nr:glycosyltransferase family 2 protein [Lachnospiraceae bacterium]
MSDKVSLIIPCYNGEKYLDTCFSCILCQTYKNVEVIVINDGSEDKSDKIIKEKIPILEKKGYIVKYFSQSNQGAAVAINNALKYVEGDYIMLYDVDDIIMPKAIEVKALFLKNHPEYGMVRNNGYYVKSNNIYSNSYLFIRSKKEKRNEWIFEDILYGKTNNWAASFMIRTSMLFNVLKEKEIYISQYGQNMQLMLPVAYYYKTGFIDLPLMRYVNFGNSHSRTSIKSRRLELINGFENNRIQIIKTINLEQRELDYYINRINIFYNHIKLDFARQIHDIKLLEEQYKKLEKNKEIKLQDRIIFLCGKYKLFNILYESIKLGVGIGCALYYRMEGRLIRK